MRKVTILWLVFVMCFSSITTFAAEKTGTIGIVLENYDSAVLKESVESEQEGAGVYVFVENIDTEKLYRFPLSESNKFEGRFVIPYGNYRVIDNPDGIYNVTCENVFSISDETPEPSISCSISKKKVVDYSKSTMPSATPEATQPPQETEKKNSGSSIQVIITGCVFAALILIWIYNRFIKYRDND